jgi:hypothetical protein
VSPVVKLRGPMLQRWEWLCGNPWCRIPHTTRALEAHVIDPERPVALNNLIPLCIICRYLVEREVLTIAHQERDHIDVEWDETRDVAWHHDLQFKRVVQLEKETR